MQQYKERFQNNQPQNNQVTLDFPAFFEINELKAQLEAKNNSVSKFKDHIATLKGKGVSECDKSKNISKEIAPGMYKIDLEPLSPKLLKNREAHVDYLKHTHENANTLREIVEQARELRPLDSDLDFACKFATRIQELLVYVSATCPSSSKKSEKLIVVTLVNKKKLGVISSTSASRSKLLGNTKKNRNSRPTSSNNKNKVEDHPRSVKSSLNNKNHVSKPVCNANVKHFILNANSELIFATYNGCMLDAIHDLCVLEHVNDVNIFNNSKPNKDWGSNVSTAPSSSHVHFRSFKSSSGTWTKGCSNASQLIDFVSKFMGTVRFRNDHVVAIRGYGDYQIGNVMISWVYYVEGKSKKHTHKPKSDDSIQQKLYLLHMDLCGPMRIESINGKKYILVIVDDYLRFTWVKFLCLNDETLEIVIKLLK
ncbi:retrovirus-related pol polyprotein from transposon TNT 1-94 [Tanacetum coccineum]